MLRRRLLVSGPSTLHRMAPHTKVLALVLFVFAVVATPREQVWAFALHAVVVAVAAGAGKVAPVPLVRRMSIEAPFLAFALLLPLVVGGPRVDVLGIVHLSEDGLWAAWSIVAKGTLGLAASLVVIATTPLTDIVRGLTRLRVPEPLTTIATLMLRYVDVAAREVERMRVARVSRGGDERKVAQLRALATTVGALFVRTFERGERVHMAMLSRGYVGSLPPTRAAASTSTADWLLALSAPAAAAASATAAWVVA